VNRAAQLAAVGVASVLTTAACADDGPSWPDDAARAVVSVSAQPCTTPNRASGLGVRIAGDLVVTAAHTVEDEIRDLRVDDQPAELLAIDPRSDLAVLRAAGDGGPSIDLAPAHATGTASASLWLVDIDDGAPRTTRLESVRPTRLTVHDTTDRQTYRREAIAFPGAVPDGTSGAPVVTADGRLAGIVVLAVVERDLSYAVAASEVETILAAAASRALEPARGCA
jgi:S1-C subfamily serine protease